MIQTTNHVHNNKFNRISDLMHRYRNEGVRPGGRPAEEYRAARRNTARLSYRIAKKAVKAQYQE
jgi:hypothetical protein